MFQGSCHDRVPLLPLVLTLFGLDLGPREALPDPLEAASLDRRQCSIQILSLVLLQGRVDPQGIDGCLRDIERGAVPDAPMLIGMIGDYLPAQESQEAQAQQTKEHPTSYEHSLSSAK